MRLCTVQLAIDECKQKHKAASPMMYGNLPYMLLVATAACKMTVLAMPVGNPEEMLEILSDPIQVRFHSKQISVGDAIHSALNT